MATKAQLESTIETLQRNIAQLSELLNNERETSRQLMETLQRVHQDAPYQQWKNINGEFVNRAISEYIHENITANIISVDQWEVRLELMDKGQPFATTRAYIEDQDRTTYF